MNNRRLLIQAGAWWVALFAMLVLTNPTHLPIFILIIPFGLLYLAIVASWKLIHAIVSDAEQKTTTVSGGALFASIVIGLIALASIGQLTLRDVLTITLLSVLGYFYISRNKKQG